MKTDKRYKFVMAGLVPGIHVFSCGPDVDARDKPGHDVLRCASFNSDVGHSGKLSITKFRPPLSIFDRPSVKSGDRSKNKKQQEEHPNAL
jgi:hypothetical protein